MANLSVPCRALIHDLFEGELSKEEFRERAMEIKSRQPRLFDVNNLHLPRIAKRPCTAVREEVKAETLPGYNLRRKVKT